MNFKKVALALILGSSMALGAVACDDGGGGGGGGGGGNDGGAVVAGCTTSVDPTSADMAQPVEMFTINRFQLPAGSSAFVVDGLDVDERATASDTDASGCFVRDTKATSSSNVTNVDNQLAAVGSAAALLGVDISKALQDAVAPASGPASLEIKVALKNWNHTPTDNCVSVGLYVGAPGSSTLLAEQVAALNGGVSGIVSGWGTLDVSVTVSGVAGCNPANTQVASCGSIPIDCSADIPLKLFGVKLRLNVQPKSGGGYQLVTNRPNPNPAPSGTDVTNPSIIGGFLYWGSKTTVEAGSFQETLKAALCELGQGDKWTQVQGIIAPKLDMHSTSTGAPPDACTAPSKATSDANALSIGAYAGAGY